MNKALYVRREEREDLLRTPWINHLIIFSAHAHRLVRLIGDIQLPRGQERMRKYMLNQMFMDFRQILTIELYNDTSQAQITFNFKGTIWYVKYVGDGTMSKFDGKSLSIVS